MTWGGGRVGERGVGFVRREAFFEIPKKENQNVVG